MFTQNFQKLANFHKFLEVFDNFIQKMQKHYQKFTVAAKLLLYAAEVVYFYIIFTLPFFA